MFEKIRQKKWLLWVLGVSLLLLTLTSRVCVAYFLANDGPGDGVVYALTARNILEQNVYSSDEEAPFKPTYFRMPGYPLFIAGVYSVFGHENNTAVRIVQAFFDTGTCVFVALIAFLWTDYDERKRRTALFAFLLASLCPFIVIYTATILSETLTTFLMAAMTLTATLAFKATSSKKSCVWWTVTGLLAGAAVFLRPDAGLFAGGIGLTLVIWGLFFKKDDSPKFFARFLQVVLKGAVFSFAFILALAPWTIRNYRVFGIFQPLAPAHGEMPGEFVPLGYERWLRTWVDDFRFIEPTLWNLDDKPININVIPAGDFDFPEERDRVVGLLDQYNHPPGSQNPSKAEADDNSADGDDSGDDASDDSADNDASSNDESDNSADDQSDDDDDDDKKYDVKMTPEIDAAFGQIADERIARSPIRYYIFLPAKRAASLWFDSHSLYYPFGGQMSPISDLDYDVNQQYWLPAFTALMWIYTLLGLGGALYLWRYRANRNLLQWLILAALMVLPRLAFFSTIENPEPRYVIELFVFAAILGGIFLGGLKRKNSETDQLPNTPPASTRMLSLDVFRGITIAAMVLVNDPGTWSAVYPPLLHSEWNGLTPTDLIFPFFLFIVGVSIALSLGKQMDIGKVGRAVHIKIFKRAFLLFALGVLLEIFPFYNLWSAAWFEPSTTRIMGVLQRIAICYLVGALIFLHTNWKRQALITAILLLGYWGLMTLINVPGCDVTSVNDNACNLAAYVDRVVLTTNHIWDQSKVFDPEGLLSTIPAIATTLAGVLTGHWLRSDRSVSRKFAGMLTAGVALVVIGWIWSFWFPLNKSLWTSSFAACTAGFAVVFLAICYWLVDLKGYRKWAVPFTIFGSNAIALYVGATTMAAILALVELTTSDNKTFSLQELIYGRVFLPLGQPVNASLLYAISFLLVWLVLMWLFYRKKIFIRI